MAPPRKDALVGAVRTWGPSVYSLALLRTGSRADAEDVYQDVFLRLATTSTEFGDDEHLKAWLLTVTVNRCRDLARTAWLKRVQPFGDEACAFADPTAETAFATIEDRELWKTVARLSPKLREVVYLHYAQDLGCDEIAGIVGCGPATVRTRLKRARDRLRVLLSEGGTYGYRQRAAQDRP